MLEPDVYDEGRKGAPSEDAPTIGTVIRRLRREKSMSLKELSAASGVSIGMLSQVERNLTSPSVRVLTAIRGALGAPLTALFQDAGAEPADPAFVRRGGHRPILELGHLRKELLSAGTSHNIQFMILHIGPNGSSGNTPLSYPAEKGGLVLSGELLLKVGAEEALLSEGDAFAFNSSLEHSFRNPGNTATKVLWIIGAVPLDRHL
jgi:transcriptional regulator with XRE-family HTH domain